MSQPDDKSAAEKLALREAAQKTIANDPRWKVSGKHASISLLPEEKALAYAMRAEIQRHVTGFTPNISESSQEIVLTTKDTHVKQARKSIQPHQL